MTNSQLPPGANVVLDKFDGLTARKRAIYEQIAALQLESRSLDSELQECVIAAKVLGFKLPDCPTMEIFDEAGSKIEERDQATRPAQSVVQATIKKQIETALKNAYPDPLWSRTIRDRLGGNVHEKTVGMTLYRLAKDGIARHDGWDWYYIPEEQREQQRIKIKGFRSGPVFRSTRETGHDERSADDNNHEGESPRDDLQEGP